MAGLLIAWRLFLAGNAVSSCHRREIGPRGLAQGRKGDRQVTIKNQAAVVGVGATPYYKRGQSYPQTELSMACQAILLAVEDAGLNVADLDGFAFTGGHSNQRRSPLPWGCLRCASPPRSPGVAGRRRGRWGWRRQPSTAGWRRAVVTLLTLQQLDKPAGRQLGRAASLPTGRPTSASRLRLRRSRPTTDCSVPAMPRR